MGAIFVSVIVPVYNAQNNIDLCIRSLLEQDYPKDRYEVIIVDNNSKDKTKEIINKYDVKYVLEDGIQSSYAARNKGIKEAVGGILAFTDSDCIADQNWIEKGVRAFHDDKIGGIGGKVCSYMPKNYIERYQAKKDVMGQEKLLTQDKIEKKLGKITTCNAFYRRKVFNIIGLFEPTIISGGDHDLSLRMQTQTDYSIAYNSEAIVYHKHRTSLKDFWKQYYKYGLGRIFLAKRYKSDVFMRRTELGYLRQIYGELRSYVPHLIYFFKNMVVFIVYKKLEDKEKVIDNILYIVARFACFSGQLKSSLRNKKPYFERIF